jgi:hypothetical protein
MKLSNAQRTFAFSVAAILMATYQLSPLPAWACAAEATGSFGYSSNTGATSVTVCAKSVTATRTVATSTQEPVAKAPVAKAPAAKAPVSKPAPKPSPAPAKVVSLLSPIKQGIPAALQKPAPKPAAKPAPKPVAAPVVPKVLAVSNPGVSILTASEEASFSPTPLTVSSSASAAALGQSVGFWANAATHYKTGVLLGKVTEVRFTPVQTSWATDQGQSAVGASVSFAFENEGSVEVAASVTYSVSYQISGASGWVSTGVIAVSDSVVVMIEDSSEPSPIVAAPPSKVVRLVGENCHSRATAFGCQP